MGWILLSCGPLVAAAVAWRTEWWLGVLLGAACLACRCRFERLRRRDGWTGPEGRALAVHRLLGIALFAVPFGAAALAGAGLGMAGRAAAYVLTLMGEEHELRPAARKGDRAPPASAA